MKGGNVCDPCSEESKKSNEAILISLKKTQELINKSQELCTEGKGRSLKTAATAVVAANRFKNISETNKSSHRNHWYLYENDSGKYWENGDESEAFWVSDVGNIVPSVWTVKASDQESGLHYFEKSGESRWYLTKDEIGETNLDESKKWIKERDTNGRDFWKKHTNKYLWEVRWIDPQNDFEKQIAKEYMIGKKTKYERHMTRTDVDTWVQQFGDKVPVYVARIAKKLRSRSNINKQRERVKRPKIKKSFTQQPVLGGKRRSLFKKKRTKKRTKSLFKKKRRTKKRTKSLFKKKRTKKRTKKRRKSRKKRRKN
jgi:hypothetical protein